LKKTGVQILFLPLNSMHHNSILRIQIIAIGCNCLIRVSTVSAVIDMGKIIITKYHIIANTKEVVVFNGGEFTP